MSMENNLKNYKCRTCFDATKGLKSLRNLATDEEESPISYGEILRQLTNINIMEDKCQEITQSICGGCSRKLKAAYAFVQQAQEVNEQLCYYATMLHQEDSSTKQMDCLQESQVDIDSCLDIKIERDDMEGVVQFEVPQGDVQLQLEESDEKMLNNTADMLDDVQIKLEDLEGNIISSHINTADMINTNVDEETIEKPSSQIISKPSIEKSDEKILGLNEILSVAVHIANADLSDCVDNNDDDSDWHEPINSCIQKKIKTKSNKPDIDKNSDEDDIAVPCNECNKIYKNSKALALHLSTCHISEDQKCSCPLCGSKFKQSCNMYKHMRTFHGPDTAPLIRKPSTRERRYQCDKCSCNYINKKDLNFHMRTKHSLENKNNEKEKFTDSLTMDSKKPKTYEQPSLCSICGSSFASKTYLTVHMRRHNGERPFKCDYCDQAYPSKMELIVHRRLHTGEKPYECKICGKVFRISDKLGKHMRSHADIRQYKCTQCERSFKYSNDLKIHFRIHTGEKPYCCNVCSSTFTQSSSLKAHRMKMGHVEK